jgi:hypothetical protein
MNVEQVKEISQFAKGEWERSFCASVIEQAEKGKALSESQLRIIARISESRNAKYVDMNDPEVAGRVFCSYVYYGKERMYFIGIMRSLESGETLSETDYEKFCKNKYASGFYDNLMAGHKFSENDIVFIDGNLYQVVECLPEASWGKDTIRYRVLNLVNFSEHIVEQKYLKLQTRKKKQ